MTLSNECLSSFAALLIKTEISPNFFFTSVILFFNFSILVKSHNLKRGTFLEFIYFLTNLLPFFSSLSKKATFEPCCRKFSTIDSPIPDAPPVIITTLSFNEG